ncbi:hypothetical protein [Synechococcus sp. J7-Johnson]|nr:hypothetical protein [Synechococcus sp. J7-Johnson]
MKIVAAAFEQFLELCTTAHLGLIFPFNIGNGLNHCWTCPPTAPC